jgi:hypothetical protein
MPIAALAPALIGAAGSIGSSVIGHSASQGDSDAAMAARQAALNQILGTKAPTIEEQRLALQKEQVAGQLSPQMEGIAQMGPSQMAGVSTDPRLAQAQMLALSQLQGLGNTGLSNMDRSALMQIQHQTSGDAQAANQAIMANMAARGMGGGGQELAARMMANQQAANSNSTQGMQVAAQAQQKALQAMMDAGSLGGQIRSQQFGEKSDVAKAQDAISQFNTANRQQVLGANTQAANQAQQYNLGNAQNVSNTNAQIANAQEVANKGLYQQQFNNQMTKAQAAAGQYGNVANQDQQQAAATQNMWSGIGQAVGGAGTAVGSYLGKNQAAPAKDLNTNNNADVGVVGPPDPRKAQQNLPNFNNGQ